MWAFFFFYLSWIHFVLSLEHIAHPLLCAIGGHRLVYFYIYPRAFPVSKRKREKERNGWRSRRAVGAKNYKLSRGSGPKQSPDVARCIGRLCCIWVVDKGSRSSLLPFYTNVSTVVFWLLMEEKGSSIVTTPVCHLYHFQYVKAEQRSLQSCSSLAKIKKKDCSVNVTTFWMLFFSLFFFSSAPSLFCYLDSLWAPRRICMWQKITASALSGSPQVEVLDIWPQWKVEEPQNECWGSAQPWSAQITRTMGQDESR